MSTIQQRESYCGFHFLSTFNCHRKGWYKYILKWLPNFVAPALSEGSAIHEGIAHFYRTADAEESFKVALDDITARKAHYEYKERWQDGYKRVALIMENWLEAWRKETFDVYKPLHVEEPREVLIPNSNYKFTYRTDVELLHLPTNEVHVHDHKTGSWNLQAIYDAFSSQRQGIAYAFALSLEPEYQGRVIRVMPDAIYQRGSVVQCGRDLSLYYTVKELKGFATELRSILDDLYTRVENYNDAHSIEAIDYYFPRNLTCDGGQEWKCEYKPICRHELTQNPPLGFKLDDRPFKDILKDGEER